MKKKNKRLIKDLTTNNQKLNYENAILRTELYGVSEALVSVIMSDLMNSEQTSVEVKNVEFDPPRTTVYFSDNTKSVAVCHSNDTFSKDLGLFVALSKKAYGNKISDYLNKYCK